MKRTITLGLIFTGVIALANGCSSSTTDSARTEPDYAAYSGLHAGQSGSGDKIGTAMFAHDNTAYPKAANPRLTPPAPRHNDVAELPED